MTKALLFPTNDNLPVTVVEVNGLADYQRLTGGYIQAAPVDREGIALYINEEGKMNGLPFNRRADNLWKRLLPNGRIPGDYIAGDAVLVGFSDEDGEDTDVPAEFLKEFGEQTFTVRYSEKIVYERTFTASELKKIVDVDLTGRPKLEVFEFLTNEAEEALRAEIEGDNEVVDHDWVISSTNVPNGNKRDWQLPFFRD